MILMIVKGNIMYMYLLVPISIIIVIVYIYFTKVNLVSQLVDPQDGGPEVMQVFEVPPTFYDYLLPSSIIGLFVLFIVYYNESKLNSILQPLIPVVQPNVVQPSVNVNLLDQISNKSVVPEIPQLPIVPPIVPLQLHPKLGKGYQESSKIHTGPADF